MGTTKRERVKTGPTGIRRELVQGAGSLGKVKENLKLLNTFQQMLAAPENQNPADQARLGSFVARFLGSTMDLSESLQSIVSVSGNLIQQQDDGIYVLSDFSLSYDGVSFLKHRE